MESKTNQKTIFFFATFLTVCIFRFAHAQNYGNDCVGETCDSSKLLFCIRRKCICSTPNLIYNETLGSCVAKLFHACTQEEIYWNRDPYTPSLSKSIKYTKRLPCVYGAYCGTSSLCICSDPDDLGTNGTCNLPYIQPNYDIQEQYIRDLTKTFINSQLFSVKILKSRKPSKVSTSLECDYTGNHNCPEDTGFLCIDGNCRCALSVQQYFNGTMCVSLVKSICNTNKTSNQNIWECTKNADCIATGGHSICQCKTGFVSSESGRCIPDYQQPCDNKEHFCRKGSLLACVNGKCECETKLHVFDVQFNRCRGLVGANCRHDEDEDLESDDTIPYSIRHREFCVAGAYCDAPKHEFKTIDGFCKCRDEYRETMNRTCA